MTGCNNTENSTNKDVQLKYNFQEVQNGDIILKMGNGPISKMIVNMLKEQIDISHCGFIVKAPDDSLYVIHSVAKQISGVDGVQSMDLNEFMKDTKPGSVFVLRHRSEKTKRDSLAMLARHYLQLKVPFDHQYNHLEPSEMYCTEFVYHTLAEIYQENFFNTRPMSFGEILSFNSLIENKNFLKITVRE